MTSDDICSVIQFHELVSADLLIKALGSRHTDGEQDRAIREELSFRLFQERRRRATADDAADVRVKLQAIVDCYGVGTKDKHKLLENLGHHILEAKELLDGIKAREKLISPRRD